MSTPADEIRAAAEKLRDLAAAISASDPRDQTFHADGCDVTQGRNGLYDVATTQTPELATYIAAFGPAVGLALAKLLDEAAHRYEASVRAADDVFHDDPAGRDDFLTIGPGAPSDAALAVARAITTHT